MLLEPDPPERASARAAGLREPPPDDAVPESAALLLRAISDTSEDVIFAKDRDGRFRFVNPATLAIVGKPLEEVLGKTDTEVLEDEDAARDVMQNDRRIMESGVAEDVEETVPMPDGTVRVWLSRKVPYRDASGQVVGLLGISRDITERKRTHEALRRSEERYRSLFTNLSEGFAIGEVICDDAGAPCEFRFTEMNEAFERQTGLDRAAVQGRPIRQVLPQVEQHWLDLYCGVALTGKPCHCDSYNRDLDRHFSGFVYSPAPGQFAVLFTDVTERKGNEAALRRANEDLRESDRRKSDFLAVLSHELRNPLAPIRNGIQLLDRAAPGSEQASRAKEVIRRQTEHLARLVDDLLDVTRISRGKVELQRARLDLREVVRRTTDDLRALFEEGRIELCVDLGAAAAWVDADPTRIAQALGNLLHNALKFTPAGGVVTVVLAAAGGRAELRVRDTGLGMRPEHLEDMFEPFAQAESGLARTAGGLGLGLALVKGVVELHGGSVRARSEGAGRGSEFVVSLPLMAAATATPDSPDRERSAPDGRVVLVIEDNVDAGQSLADLLEFDGHRVRLALDGRSGIALARELRPDVVLCDIGLPDVDGYEVARTLRRDEALRSTRLIAVSGYAQPEDRRRAFDAGFDGHIPKPPDPEELLKALATQRT